METESFVDIKYHQTFIADIERVFFYFDRLRVRGVYCTIKTVRGEWKEEVKEPYEQKQSCKAAVLRMGFGMEYRNF